MNLLVWAYLSFYFINYVDVHLGIFTLTIRDTILSFIPLLGLKQILTDPPFRKRILPILIFFTAINMISIIYILLNFSFPISTILKRTLVQYFKHLLIVFELYIGFRLFYYVTPKEFVRLQTTLAVILGLLGLYQIFAEAAGLPSWGISTFRDEEIGATETGVRPNSLLGEPKYFAAYMALCCYLCYLLNFYSLRSKSFLLPTFLMSLFLWYMTQSGNGILAALTIVSVSYFLSGVNFYLKVGLGFFITFGAFYVWENAEQFLVRPSHKLLVTALKQGTFAQFTLLLDDLVRLPLMAFAKYTTFVWMGFGLGLLTFYATEFLQFAKWKTAGWIDSNINLISNISNYGLIFLIFLVYFMTSNFLKARDRKTVSPEVNLTTKYLYYSFLVGLFVSGRHTALIFLAIGYMMSTTLDLEEQIPQDEHRLDPG